MKRMLFGVACAMGIFAGNPVFAAGMNEAPLEGFGNDIPLALAARQIVPPSLSVSFGTGTNQDMKVSWRGGSDWKTVLDNLVRAHNMTVTYSADGVRITDANKAYDGAVAAPSVMSSPTMREQRGGGLVVLPYAPPAKPAATIVQEQVAMQPPAQQQPAMNVSPLPEPVAKPSRIGHSQAGVPDQPMSAPNAWRAKRGQTLDQVLGDWADKAGWTVVFSSRMIYELEAGAEFNGDFLEAATTLVRSIHANPRPIATFYRGNHVLVVSNSADNN